jgi:hypothetical protein
MVVNSRSRLTSVLTLWGALFLVIATTPTSRAQGQDPAPQGAPPPSQDSKNGSDSSAKDSDSAANSGLSSTPAVNAIGTASLLGMPNGALRWGSFYVSDVSFIQSYDHANYVGPSTGSNFTGASATTNTSLFQTDLVFNHLSRYGQIALQYQPRLAVTNGNVYPDYSNQNIAFNLIVTHGARWYVELHDRLSYFSSQNLYGSTFGDVSSETGTTVQNNFIDGPGSLLSEIAGLTVGYRWTPRTTISFSPSYTYVRSTGSLLGKTSSDLYTGSVAVNHQLSPRQTIGAFFSGQYIKLLGQQGSTQIYSMGLNYSRQMGRSWFISASFAGVNTPGTSTVHPWTYTGTASIARTFRQFSVGLVYSRQLAQGYVTSEFADREDGYFTWRITESLRWRTSIDAQREARVSSPIAAYYGANELNWRMASRVSGFVNYGYRLQNGDASQVLRGHRSFVSGGIVWSSSRLEPY